MAESIWNAIDEYLSDHIKNNLGLQSSYTTLPIETAIATAIQSVRDWEEWQLPAVAIVGTRARRTFGGHKGDGKRHYDKSLPYRIVAIVEGDQATATTKAKTLEKRLEVMTHTLQFNTIVADDGERVQKWSVGQSDIMVLAKPRSDKLWYGLAIVDLEIETHI